MCSVPVGESKRSADSDVAAHSNTINMLSSVFPAGPAHFKSLFSALGSFTNNKTSMDIKVIQERVIIDSLRCPVNSVTDLLGNFSLQYHKWPLGKSEARLSGNAIYTVLHLW